jgi:exopolysaccharide biosynthesis protein
MLKNVLIFLLLFLPLTYFFFQLQNGYSSFGSESVLGSNSGGQNITTNVGDGYSYVSVKTNLGTFYAHVYKAKLSSINIKSVAANKDTCKNNCPTKPLKQYIDENGALAGMNGTYFCPPDYPNCKSKTNSFDFAFYNSNQKKWLNKNSLKWNKTAAMTVKNGKVKFCMDTTKCSSDGVSAGISNYPALLQDGRIVVEKGDVQQYQKQKGTKGAIGTDGSNIYLILSPSTTINEFAYVCRALGMTSALNVDGGGSSAMYAGGRYRVGPGRSLPNAIVLTKK